MDDRTRTVAQETPAWEPERRNGKVEIGVNCWNEASQRMVFDSVSPQRYIELSDTKQLKHQQENKSKPEHLPTRDEVVRFLEQEKLRAPASTPKFLSNKPGAMTASMPAIRRQPKKEESRGPTAIRSEAAEESEVTTVVVPKDSFLAEHFGLADKPAAKPVGAAKTQELPALGFELDVGAAAVFYLNEHEKEIIQDLIKNRTPAGMSKISAAARLSGLCSKLGIPKTHRFEAYDRRGALRQVWARYVQIRDEERRGRELPSRADLERQSIKAEEEELLKIFRNKGSRGKAAILGFARKI